MNRQAEEYWDNDNFYAQSDQAMAELNALEAANPPQYNYSPELLKALGKDSNFHGSFTQSQVSPQRVDPPPFMYNPSQIDDSMSLSERNILRQASYIDNQRMRLQQRQDNLVAKFHHSQSMGMFDDSKYRKKDVYDNPLAFTSNPFTSSNRPLGSYSDQEINNYINHVPPYMRDQVRNKYMRERYQIEQAEAQRQSDIYKIAFPEIPEEKIESTFGIRPEPDYDEYYRDAAREAKFKKVMQMAKAELKPKPEPKYDEKIAESYRNDTKSFFDSLEDMADDAIEYQERRIKRTEQNLQNRYNMSTYKSALSNKMTQLYPDAPLDQTRDMFTEDQEYLHQKDMFLSAILSDD